MPGNVRLPATPLPPTTIAIPMEPANMMLAYALSLMQENGPLADGAQNFFNAYLLSKNGAPDGTACALYTIPWGTQYATNCDQFRGSDHWTIDNSYGYNLVPQDPGHI